MIEELKKKAQQYRDIAAQCQRDAIANNGAAQAIDQLIKEMEAKDAQKDN
jgi:hypothetical protein